MKYFELTDDVVIPGRRHLGEVFTETGQAVHFSSGMRAGISNGLATAITHGMRPLSFILTSFADPVATEELGAAIERIAGEEAQLIPLKIPSGVGGYVILNATRRVACLDEARSQVLKWTEHDERPFIPTSDVPEIGSGPGPTKCADV